MTHETYNDPKWVDGVIFRKARKRWQCWGNGARTAQHAAGCPEVIEPGDAMIEYVLESPMYQTGSHHTMVCAEAFFTQTAHRVALNGIDLRRVSRPI